MTLKRTGTIVGPPRHSKGKGRPQPALKRTSKKGAYATNRKKAIRTRLMPLMETKSWKDSDLALIITASSSATYGDFADPRTSRVLNASMSNISPMCDKFGFNGLDGSTFMGDNRYHKLLSQKIQFTFPQGENIPLVPQELWLIHGWVLDPLNVSTITSGAVQPELVNPAFLTQYITEQVKEWFNERNDVLDWVSKNRSTIKILGKKLVRPRSNNRAWSSAANSLGAGLDGYPADAQVIPDSPLYQLTWNMNRKADMYEGPIGGATGPRPLHFEKGNWLAFSIAYQPKFEDQYPSDAARVSVRYDSKIYYNDM